LTKHRVASDKPAFQDDGFQNVDCAMAR
jgi:hypothetical protein